MAKRRATYHAKEALRQPPKAAESSVYERGQTVIPKAIRETLSIAYGARLHWEIKDGVIHVLPIPPQPVQALRGALKGAGITSQTLLRQRQQERQRERQAEEKGS